MFSRLGRRRGGGSEASRAAVHPRAPGPQAGDFIAGDSSAVNLGCHQDCDLGKYVAAIWRASGAGIFAIIADAALRAGDVEPWRAAPS